MTTTYSKNGIVGRFEVFHGGTGGIDSWLGPEAPDQVFEVLGDIDANPLTRARLNQLLTLAKEAPVSQALFSYYWLTVPAGHPYDVRGIPCFNENSAASDNINSLDQLFWGLYRFYVDALLFFGNVRTAYKELTAYERDELNSYFQRHRYDTVGLAQRGDPISPVAIAKDNRYLISEMACKSFDAPHVPDGELATALMKLYVEHIRVGGGPVTAKQLLTGAYDKGQYVNIQPQLDLSSDDFQEEMINSQQDLEDKIKRVAGDFERARRAALENTRMYLSMVGDLDVYVATSMRTRDDFRAMADFCESVFGNDVLRDFRLRYFDPTLSAASHHEDKGLIECLMVRCAKVLVLHAGTRDSYGKDAEAAMALSLGKPVIIQADEEYRSQFFRDVHPLSRLIEFETGVAIGAMVATSADQVVELVRRIFSNQVEYELSQPRANYLVLKEKLTGSVVRLQTSDELLRETFWNHYHDDLG